MSKQKINTKLLSAIFQGRDPLENVDVGEIFVLKTADTNTVLASRLHSNRDRN
jgi:hypothetical protein